MPRARAFARSPRRRADGGANFRTRSPTVSRRGRALARKVFTLQSLPAGAAPGKGGDFSLHAGVAASADELGQRAIVPHHSRPAVPEARLSLTAGGNVQYPLKTSALHDGPLGTVVSSSRRSQDGRADRTSGRGAPAPDGSARARGQRSYLISFRALVSSRADSRRSTSARFGGGRPFWRWRVTGSTASSPASRAPPPSSTRRPSGSRDRRSPRSRESCCREARGRLGRLPRPCAAVRHPR